MTTTALDRTATAQGLLDEYERFAELVAGLNDKQWTTPSRCEGFDVRDVAGHVIGLAEDVAAGKPGTRNAEEEAASVRGDAPRRAAERLRAVIAALQPLLTALDDDAWNGPSGVPDLTFGRGVLVLWYDAFVHGDDIRAALGMPSVHGDGLRASVEYVTTELQLRGWNGKIPTFADMPYDPLDFVLAATGRIDAAKIGLAPDVNIYA
jgi:uncharacterized protein (TIGR03083 family)